MLIDAYHDKVQPWTILDPTLTLPLLKSLKAVIDNMVMSAGGTDEHCQHQGVRLRKWDVAL